MAENQNPPGNRSLHLLLNVDEELPPEMNQLISLAQEHGYGVQEVKKVLPSRLMRGLRHFFLGEVKRRSINNKLPKGPCKIPNCRKHIYKPKMMPKRGFGRRPITDTLMLRKKQKLKKQKEMEKKKKNNQFRIFGITFGGKG